MKYPVALEFKETIVFSDDSELVTIPAIYDFPRLITAYPRPGSPAGSDREICRTVNGAIKLELLDYTTPPTGDDLNGLFATACLMGAYGGVTGIIQEHSFGPSNLGLETTGVIRMKNPVNDQASNLYSTANMSAGAYGFDYFSSYSNLMDSIFIRLEIMRSSFSPTKARFLASGFLLAGDPA